MTRKMLSIPVIAAAMMLGSAGMVFAQSSAPMPTGSAGNSNTGPGARPPAGTTEAMPTRKRRTHRAARVRQPAVRATTPMPTGSAGNSNTGPGAKPPQ